MTRKVSVVAATVISLACGTNVKYLYFPTACADPVVHILRMGAPVRFPLEPFRDAEQPDCERHRLLLAGC